MSRPLRADTEVIVTVGPFLDVTDGKTPETTVTLAAMDECELIKHGSTSVVDISGATWAAVTNCDGYYSLTLTTSHTDTEGQIIIVFQDDDVFLPTKFEFEVMNAVAYDALYAAATTDYLQVDVRQWLGQAVTADSNVPEVHVVGIDDGVITAAKLGADCITNAKIADDAIAAENLATDAITSDALAASACTKIIDDFETQSQADPTGFHVNVLEVNGTAQTANDNGADINAILVDTNELQTDLTNDGRLDLLIDSILADTNELQGLIADSKIAADIKAVTAGVDFSATMKASINTEVCDVLKIDTLTEPSQGAPTATPTMEQVLKYLYIAWRNKMTMSSTERAIYDDAGTTKLVSATCSDASSVLTKGEYGTGA